MKYTKVWGISLWYKWSRCPWQVKELSPALDIDGRPIGERWGWRFWKDGGMGRFGSGWVTSLGIRSSGTSVIIDWLFGSLRLTTIDPEVAKRELEEIRKRFASQD
jgi:hypothetical protein